MVLGSSSKYDDKDFFIDWHGFTGIRRRYYARYGDAARAWLWGHTGFWTWLKPVPGPIRQVADCAHAEGGGIQGRNSSDSPLVQLSPGYFSPDGGATWHEIPNVFAGDLRAFIRYYGSREEEPDDGGL